jgi:hypothetical protein
MTVPSVPSSAAPAPSDPADLAAGIVPSGLRFHDDGTFTVVQFNDTQDGPRTDRRTIELQCAVLDDVHPDLVVINGDVIDGRPTSALEVRQAFNNVVLPMEERGIAWAVTFGNHDEDSAEDTGLYEKDFLEFVGRYPHNVNTAGADGVTGSGNQVLTIGASDRKASDGKTADAGQAGATADGTSGNDAASGADGFAVWLLDSGRYAPDTVAGQDFEGYPSWDWIRPDQVRWYTRTSQELERRNGKVVSGLVFQHIALWEHRFMWFASVDARSDADHERAIAKHQVIGERNEEECTGPMNGGLFAAMLERGDVRGVYVGHDHTNTYDGDYYGIRLGYAPGTGFGTYGLDGEERNRLRGARVFHLDENVDGVLDRSELRLAAEYGIDLTAEIQESEPAPFPAGLLD